MRRTASAFGLGKSTDPATINKVSKAALQRWGKGVLKIYSKYTETPIPKFDFNKVAKQHI